ACPFALPKSLRLRCYAAGHFLFRRIVLDIRGPLYMMCCFEIHFPRTRTPINIGFIDVSAHRVAYGSLPQHQRRGT
ncbi:MAG: hypothetical protein WCA15_14545, partial [Candidatus Acidiferrales bacterium]